MPGRVPRGSFPLGDGAKGFSPLSRFLLDKLDRGVVLLDAEGAVVDTNSCAQKVLGGKHGIVVRNGRLTFADTRFDERFVKLLGTTRAAGRRSIAALLRRADGLFCRIVVAHANSHGAQSGVRYVALLYPSDGMQAITAEVLTELYGLTRAQADVARLLYAGFSVEETAERLELSLNTVRSHLKQIFSRCEVQSQRELLQMLATGPRTL